MPAVVRGSFQISTSTRGRLAVAAADWRSLAISAASGSAMGREGPAHCFSPRLVSPFACCRMGFCPESAWPYDVSKFAVKPPAEAVWAAYDQRGKVDTNYHRIDTVTGSALLKVMKQALTAGYLFNFGTPVTEAFCSGQAGTTPNNPAMPPTDGQDIAGGHSMAVCGYDDTVAKPFFRVVNSWGKDFGDGGFCYFDATYLTWEQTNDMWICVAAPRFSGGAS